MGRVGRDALFKRRRATFVYCLTWGLVFEAALAGSVRFTDATEAAGIEWTHRREMTSFDHVVEQMGSGAAFFDFDNDGWLDLYVVQSGALPNDGEKPSGSALYRNAGDGRFEDVTDVAGVRNLGRCGMGVVAGDFDNDGFQDLYVTNYGPNRLYRNHGDGSFTDVTEAAGVGDDRWGTSAVFFDYDLDGDLDLYVCNFLDCPRHLSACLGEPGPDQERVCSQPRSNGTPDALYRNNGDGSFSDVSAEAGIIVDVNQAKGLGVAAGDFDNDGFPDLYVANDTKRNFLFRNLADGRFEEVSLSRWCGYSQNGVAQGSMGVDFGDMDRDGWLDMFTTNFSEETNALYLNRGGLFFDDVAIEVGLGSPSWLYSGFGTKLVDLDNDGDLDIPIVNGHIDPDVASESDRIAYAQPPQVFLNRGDANFEEVSLDAGAYFRKSYVGRGAAFGDYDNDGDTDMFVVNSNARPVLLRNDTDNGFRWLRVSLEGVVSNRDAVGARVYATVNGATQMFERHSGASYCSSSDPRVLIGLGEADAVDELVVRWPSGVAQTLLQVAANQTLRLIEPTGGRMSASTD